MKNNNSLRLIRPVNAFFLQKTPNVYADKLQSPATRKVCVAEDPNESYYNQYCIRMNHDAIHSKSKIRTNVRQITRRQRRRLMKMDASSLTTTTIIVIIIMNIYIITHRRWSWYILSTIFSRRCPSAFTAFIIIQHLHFYL